MLEGASRVPNCVRSFKKTRMERGIKRRRKQTQRDLRSPQRCHYLLQAASSPRKRSAKAEKKSAKMLKYKLIIINSQYNLFHIRSHEMQIDRNFTYEKLFFALLKVWKGQQRGPTGRREAGEGMFRWKFMNAVTWVALSIGRAAKADDALEIQLSMLLWLLRLSCVDLITSLGTLSSR